MSFNIKSCVCKLLQKQIRLWQQAIPVLIGLLSQHQSMQLAEWSFIKAITCLIKNLTVGTEDNVCKHEELHTLFQLLYRIRFSIRYFDKQNVVDIETTAENILRTMNSLPFIYLSQIVWHRPNYLSVLHSFLDYSRESVVQIATNILNKLLVQDKMLAVDLNPSGELISQNELLCLSIETNDFKIGEIMNGLAYVTDTECIQKYSELPQLFDELSWDSYFVNEKDTAAK